MLNVKVGLMGYVFEEYADVRISILYLEDQWISVEKEGSPLSSFLSFREFIAPSSSGVSGSIVQLLGNAN
jgi:hypothetical protein